MARRRQKRAKTRTITRTVVKRAKSSKRKENLLTLMATAGLYGGVRGMMSDYVAPFTRPFLGSVGNIADEVGLAAVHYAGYKFVKNSTAKQFFKAGLMVEAARIGEAVSSGSVLPTTSTSSAVVIGQ